MRIKEKEKLQNIESIENMVSWSEKHLKSTEK